MSEPIYLLVLGKGYTEAYYQLSEEDRANLWAKVGEIEKRAGAKYQTFCHSRWADEEIWDWGVIVYPDIEAYQKKVEELEKLDWWRYFSAKTILGTKFEE